jgi:hypothetical protein
MKLLLHDEAKGGYIMRTVTTLMLILLYACSAPESDEAMSTDSESGSSAGAWMTLFDGNTLDAFNRTGDANWMIDGGTVGADSGGGMLVTQQPYEDFELEAEFWVDVPANSGIFIRCQDPENVSATNCYEVNIFDTRPDQTYRTGGIVDVASPLVELNAGGRWNRYEISANGPRLHVVLNGEVVVDTEDDRHASGYIGFQYGSGVVKFRNIRIRTL